MNTCLRLIVVLFLTGSISPAAAATFSVINPNNSGDGSLAQAITNANSSPGDDIITFDLPGPGPHDIAINAPLPNLASNISLLNDRPGDEQVRVYRDNGSATKFRIFAATAGTNVLIAGLILENGDRTDGAGSDQVGAAILSVEATVAVRRCHIRGNRAGNGGGGIAAFGAAANLTVIETGFSSNMGGSSAGAIAFAGGTMTVSGCTFQGNSANISGAISNSSSAVITNCTFAFNIGTAGPPGAIHSFGAGNLTLTHCTFSGNSSSFGANSDLWNNATMQVGNNIFAAPAGQATIVNSGSFTSTGWNLSNDAAGGDTGTGPGGFLSGPGDKRNTNPMLGSFGEHGGPTFTMPLLAGSSAIDAGTADGLSVDQRGFVRPTDNPGAPNAVGSDGSDIGAFEAGLPQNGPAFIVTNTNSNDNGCTTDECSLLEAIKASNASSDPNTITFAAGVGPVIENFIKGGFPINTPVNIIGPGARHLAISGRGVNRIFDNFSGDTTISGLTLRDGLNNSGHGGAVFNDGVLTLRQCAIVGAEARDTGGSGGNGGGLYNTIVGVATLSECTFSGNKASLFGGGAVFNAGTLTASNCTFWGNSAPSGGAILSVSSNGTSFTTIRNCTITNNTATSTASSTSGGGGYYGEGAVGNSLHHFSNTILAGNINGVNPDLRGYGTSEGNNLVGNLGQIGSGFTDGVNGDKVGVNPALGLIGNYGGPTDTVSLLGTSPAVNSGNDNLAPPADQRGYGRNGPSDIGAFEFAGLLPVTLANISTRLRVETGDNVLIGGFIITGTQNKRVIIRAIGPSLPFAGRLENPTLELRDGAGTLLDSNDDWVNSPNSQAILDTTIPPSNDFESAIVATLPAGAAGYTAIVRGANGGTGIGVVEAYDLDRSVDSKLANISTRGFVSTADNVLIAGTIVLGQSTQKVIIRAIAPSLPIAGKLENPTLELRDGNGALLEANDNWVDSPNKQAILDSTIPPANDLESAIVQTLSPAAYTAIVRGVNDSTGIAVVEVYALN